jgi:hypothetical protein
MKKINYKTFLIIALSMNLNLMYLSNIIFTYSNDFKLYLNDNDDIFGIIEIIKPSSSDIIIIGEKFLIKWNSKGGIEQVSVGLYRNSKFIESIALITLNDGSLEWEVGFYDEASDYSIGIWDYNDYNCGDSSDYFNIALEQPLHIDLLLIIALSGALCAIFVLSYAIFRILYRNSKIKHLSSQ